MWEIAAKTRSVATNAVSKTVASNASSVSVSNALYLEASSLCN